MLGGVPSGAMQRRVRIAVSRGGQDSPGWIAFPRPPPGPPRPPVAPPCAASEGALSAAVRETRRNALRMRAPGLVGRFIEPLESPRIDSYNGGASTPSSHVRNQNVNRRYTMLTSPAFAGTIDGGRGGMGRLGIDGKPGRRAVTSNANGWPGGSDRATSTPLSGGAE